MENHEDRLSRLEEGLRDPDQLEVIAKTAKKVLQRQSHGLEQEVLNARQYIDDKMKEIMKKNLEKMCQDAVKMATEARDEIYALKKKQL